MLVFDQINQINLFKLNSHENTDSETKRSTTVIVVIDSFESKVIRVKVNN